MDLELAALLLAKIGPALSAATVVGGMMIGGLRWLVRREVAPVVADVKCIRRTVDRELKPNGSERAEAHPDDEYKPLRVVALRTSATVRSHDESIKRFEDWIGRHDERHGRV